MKNSILECETIEEVEELLKNKDPDLRLDAYRALGFTQKAFEDEDWYIRFAAYEALGFTPNAFDDEDARIRLEAYNKLGFTKKAFDDESCAIRLAAYKALGFTEKSLHDEFWNIRLGAEKYFHVQKLKEKNHKEKKEDAHLIYTTFRNAEEIENINARIDSILLYFGIKENMSEDTKKFFCRNIGTCKTCK